jgi:DNA polymerase (family 10)
LNGGARRTGVAGDGGSAVDRSTAATVLAEIATLLELQGANRFKVRAYAGAARALERAAGSLHGLIATGTLGDIEGIGPATRSVIEELAATGASAYHEELQTRTPLGLLELLRVPGLGAAKVRTLQDELGIDTLDALETAAREGRLLRLKGFGPRVQAAVLDGIGFVRASSGRRLLSAGDRAARRFATTLADLDGVRDVRVVGTLRRREEVHREAALLASAEPEAREGVLEAFVALPALLAAERDAPSVARGYLADGFGVRLRVVDPADFALALVEETGTREHVEAFAGRATLAGLELRGGRLLDGEGEPVAVEDEAGAYAAVGLAWVPPELREGMGETDLAASGSLPRLLDADDVMGCLHNHTTWSDGSASVAAMAEAALARGWRWLGIADHSAAAAYAGGLDGEALAEQREEIDDWNATRGEELWLFHGVEADILPDGGLDLADEEGVLASLDYVVASVHSSFGLDERAQTERVLAAIAHPAVTILGHATGRRLLQREGYRIDLEAIMRFAAESGIAIEINASPRRLDLPWRWWHRARVLGVETVIDPDAHATVELDYVRFGVDVARKGRLDPDAVWNTLGLEQMRARLKRHREADDA